MTAMGGAVAVRSMLPGKWAKPEVVAGALPIHAQGTQDVMINTLTLAEATGPTPFAPEIQHWIAEFNYTDPFGKADNNAQLYASVECV